MDTATIKTLTTVESDRVSSLSPGMGIALVRHLLWAEAWRLGIPRHKVTISDAITIQDGGIDANVETDGHYDSILLAGPSHYQMKTGESFKPWQKAQIRIELFGDNSPSLDTLGAEVRRGLEHGAIYSLITLGHDLTTEQRGDAKKWLNHFFSLCGFADARIEVLGINQIIGALEMHPSLCLDINGLGQLPFQTTASWTTASDMTLSLALGENQETFIASLQEEIRSADIQHIRIIGEPGIGKSRLMLEAISRNEDMVSSTMYVRQASDFQNSLLFTELLRQRRQYSIILVIDECEEKDRSEIWRALKGRLGIKLITIDHGPEESGGTGMKTMSVPPLANGQVEQILRTYIGERDGLRNWAEWCEGSARVAHALGENLRDNPEDILRPPGTVPIWDRYISGYREEHDGGRAKLVLRHLALFEKFGFRQPVQNEADYIADLIEKADPSITRPKFDEIVNYYLKRRILQGDRTLRIVPKALRVYLWRNWWENYGSSANVEGMLSTMPKSLYGWFMRPFAHAHSVEYALDVVKRLLDPRSGLFSDRTFLTGETGSKFISVLAEAAPDAALVVLRQILKWSEADVKAIDSISRQHLTRALERIAIWKSSFHQSVRVMARLTLGERSNYSNNCKGTFSDLFSPIGAATKVPFAERVAFAIDLLSSTNEFERIMGLIACSQSFNLNSSGRIVGVEFQGLRPKIDFWHPTLWDELIGPWNTLIKEMLKSRSLWNSNWIVVVDKELLEAIEHLIRANVSHENCLVALRELSLSEHNFESVYRLIVHFLRYLRENLPKAMETELLVMRATLNGIGFNERLRRYVLSTLSEVDIEEEIEEQSHAVETGISIRQALAVEMVTTKNLFAEALPKLFKSGSYYVGQFGIDVSNTAQHDQFDAVIMDFVKNNLEDTTYQFMWGYLRGVFNIDSERWQGLALALLSAPNRWKLLAVASSGVSDLVFKHFLECHQSGIMDNTCIAVLCRDPIRPILGLHRTRQAIRSILDKRGDQFYETVVEMTERSLCKGDADPADEELTIEVLTNAVGLDNGLTTMADYHWGELAIRFLQQFPRRKVDLFRLLIEGTKSYQGLVTGNKISEIAAQICAEHPGETWPIVGEALLSERAYILEDWLGENERYGKTQNPPFLSFIAENVLKWVDEFPEERAAIIAKVLPQTLDVTPGGKFTQNFLERYINLDGIAEEVIFRFFGTSYRGSRSEYLASKRDLARQWMTEINNSKVASWLEEYIASLNDQINQARIGEERQF